MTTRRIKRYPLKYDISFLKAFAAFAVFAPPATGYALPADWECAQTYNNMPRHVHAGQVSILNHSRMHRKKLEPVSEKTMPFRLDMVRVPPGKFKLGSPPTEKKRERYEGPQQNVSIEYSFEIGATEVTFGQWDVCVREGGCKGYKPSDAGWGRGERPVINVSWDDAQHFITWLNRKTGKFYRLPSESEWEYVARAGTTTPFYTGIKITSDDANFNGTQTYNDNAIGTYLRQTVPVGRYPANQFGVYDIIGNAFEWTQDCWNDTHQGNSNDGLDRSDGDCKFRVMKGGSWVSYPDHLRVSKRTRYVTNYRYDDYGFRLARTIK